MENENEQYKSKIRPFWLNIAKWFKDRTSKEVNIITAYDAYVKATYIENTNLEGQIKYHQSRINASIRDKINNNHDRYNFSYRCVYSFPDNMAPYISRILEPFINKGYQVINISERIAELKEDNVYIISWYREKL